MLPKSLEVPQGTKETPEQFWDDLSREERRGLLEETLSPNVTREVTAALSRHEFHCIPPLVSVQGTYVRGALVLLIRRLQAEELAAERAAV